VTTDIYADMHGGGIAAPSSARAVGSPPSMMPTMMPSPAFSEPPRDDHTPPGVSRSRNPGVLTVWDLTSRFSNTPHHILAVFRPLHLLGRQGTCCKPGQCSGRRERWWTWVPSVLNAMESTPLPQVGRVTSELPQSQAAAWCHRCWVRRRW